MATGEVIRLTRHEITEIISQLPQEQALPQEQPPPQETPENRQQPRWPSHGTVEVRPLHARQVSSKSGTVRNISAGGLGMSSEHYFEPDSIQEIVVHLSHASFSSKASVRYCKKVRGEYMTGLAFMLES
jgi:hypothetical protein